MLELRRTYEALKPELEAHLLKEEETLFPMCRELDGAEVKPVFHCRTVDNPIGVMVDERERGEEGALHADRGCSQAFCALSGLRG